MTLGSFKWIEQSTVALAAAGAAGVYVLYRTFHHSPAPRRGGKRRRHRRG